MKKKEGVIENRMVLEDDLTMTPDAEVNIAEAKETAKERDAKERKAEISRDLESVKATKERKKLDKTSRETEEKSLERTRKTRQSKRDDEIERLKLSAMTMIEQRDSSIESKEERLKEAFPTEENIIVAPKKRAPRAQKTALEKDPVTAATPVAEEKSKVANSPLFLSRTTPEKKIETPKKESGFKKLLRRFGLFGLASMSAAGAAHANDAKPIESGKDVAKRGVIETSIDKDSLAKRNAIRGKGFEDSTQEDHINVYSSSKTKEGGITPTGHNNSFYENEYGVTEQDLYRMGKKYGFRMETEKDFQSDLIDYLIDHHPEIIEHAFEKYGQPAKGKNIKSGTLKERAEGLKDGLLGVRTPYMINELKNLPPATPSKELAAPQPEGGFIINVRGDESGGKGAYYFLKSKEDFDKVVKTVGHLSVAEPSGDGTKGQETFDMNQDVFLEYYAKTPEIQKILGKAWLRDPNDDKKFIEKKTTAHFYEGLAQK